MDLVGIDVEVITLMAPSLSDTLGVTPLEDLQAWADTYGIEGPVLADRGYGYWPVGLFAEASLGGFGYPTWLIVAPDLTVIDGGVGYSSWSGIAVAIEEHAGG
jgi:hypothetical protein